MLASSDLFPFPERMQSFSMSFNRIAYSSLQYSHWRYYLYKLLLGLSCMYVVRWSIVCAIFIILNVFQYRDCDVDVEKRAGFKFRLVDVWDWGCRKWSTVNARRETPRISETVTWLNPNSGCLSLVLYVLDSQATSTSSQWAFNNQVRS